MDLFAFLAMSTWTMVLALGWAWRDEWRWSGLAPDSTDRSDGVFSEKDLAVVTPWRPWAALIGCSLACLLLASPADSPWMAAGLLIAAGVTGTRWWSQALTGRNHRLRTEAEDILWIVRQRGTVQDQIMRACEREAMERRLRRCRATLMLTRRGGRDLAGLFRRLEAKVATMEEEPLEAAAIIGGFAAHLRHVFMESDRDDIPFGEACMHVERWAGVLRTLGAEGLEVTGAPAADSPLYARRIPAMLMLGATERLGMAALEGHPETPAHWHWSCTEHTVHLEAISGAKLQLASEDIRDWDAAFMLRHGGLAHAGGIWSFELPLLPA